MSEGIGMRKSKPTILRWFAVVVVAICAITGAFYIDTQGGHIDRQIALASSRQPERLSELFFADPHTIPPSLKAGATMPISFTIHNLESQDMDYHYVVTLTDEKGVITPAVNESIRMQHNASRTITHHVTLPTTTGKSKVSVKLINKSQSIHFWLERT